MRKLKNSQGLGSVALIVLLAVIAVVVYGGGKMIKKQADLPGFQSSIDNDSEETGVLTEGVELKQDLDKSGDQLVLVENFDKTGSLTDWDANTERQTGDWILLYEEPGRLAIVAKLAFNTLSKCDLGNGEEVCDKSKLELGATARVKGNEKNGIVTVIRLTKLAGQ